MSRNQRNMWSMLRLLIIAIILLSLLDCGAEARKNRRGKKKGKREKKAAELGDKKPPMGSRRQRRERVDRERKDKLEASAKDIKAPTLIQLFQLQQRQDHKRKADALRNAHVKPQHIGLSKNDMVNYLKNDAAYEEGPMPTTALVLAKVDFLIHREHSPHFYRPTSTISSVTSSGPGLVSVHSSPGKFGIHSKSESVFGRLIHISDAGRSNSHFACNGGFANKAEIPRNEPWIALISRGHCSFFTKIKLAEKHNATAVVLYDHKEGDIPEMFTLGTNIVALAINQRDGHKVARLADGGKKVFVNVTIDNEEKDATTSAAVDDKLRVGSSSSVSSSLEDPDNGATKAPIMTSLVGSFAILAILFQNHVTC